ncbi:MAG: O-antigen ligase family protein [Piscinibacter sp.]|uniref:O-antigen ligase family protein n=1 Tax=Piscinibacter sp. TaxID=1903157 RepID=UPI003D09F060
MLRPPPSRRLALAAAVVLIVAGSQLGMLWLAHAYLDAERGADVLSIEALCGMAAILLALLSSRISVRPRLPAVLAQDRVGRWLFAFLAACIAGEVFRPDRTFEHITTFVSIGAYYVIGVFAGRWFASERASVPVLPFLLSIHTVWYLGLLVFYARGDLGFYGILPDSDVLRLEFRSGFTATELPIYVGFQLPVLLYVLFVPHGALLTTWALALLVCAAGLVYLSASSAAMAALLMVFVVVLLARRGASLASFLRVAAACGLAVAALAAVAEGVVQSAEGKLLAFFSSEGIRALIYGELLGIIQSQPMGIGKSRFVQQNNFSWLGEGVFPHNNVLGIGAEMGVPAMLLFLALGVAVLLELGRLAWVRREDIPRRVRVLVAIALGTFLYQQFRGLFQDTWVVKETYFWLGTGVGAGLALARVRTLPMPARAVP